MPKDKPWQSNAVYVALFRGWLVDIRAVSPRLYADASAVERYGRTDALMGTMAFYSVLMELKDVTKQP